MEKSGPHVSCHKNEWKLAGYLGCATLPHLRKLRFSSATLNWYSVFYRKYCHTSPLNVLGLLRDIDNISETFPNILGKLMEKYLIFENSGKDRDIKIINNSHVDYIYTSVLYWLADDLGKQPQGTAESLKSSSEIFSVMIGRYNSAAIEHPNMGPLKEFGEAILETYSRVKASSRRVRVVRAKARVRVSSAQILLFFDR